MRILAFLWLYLVVLTFAAAAADAAAVDEESESSESVEREGLRRSGFGIGTNPAIIKSGIIEEENGASYLQYTDGEGREQLYLIPETLKSLPERDRIREAMNSLLEETLDDIEQLLSDVENLALKGVDLESEAFAIEDDDDDLFLDMSSMDMNEIGEEFTDDDDDDVATFTSETGETFTYSKQQRRQHQQQQQQQQQSYSSGDNEEDISSSDNEMENENDSSDDDKDTSDDTKDETEENDDDYDFTSEELHLPRTNKKVWDVVNDNKKKELSREEASQSQPEISSSSTSSSPRRSTSNNNSTGSSSTSAADTDTTASTAALTAQRKKLYTQSKIWGMRFMQRERNALVKLFEQVQGSYSSMFLKKDWKWLDENVDHCDWGGITCGPLKTPVGSYIATVSTVIEEENYVDEEEEEEEEEVVEEGTVKVDLRLFIPDTVLKIDLTRSGLEGTLPTSIVELENLAVLHLSGNRLKGTIPHEYYSYPRDCNHHDASDANRHYCSSFGLSTNLRVLDLGYNDLSGSIPVYFFCRVTTHLEELRLASNDFTGTFPSDCGSSNDTNNNNNNNYYHGLQLLDLSDNRLSGTLPSSFDVAQRLSTLQLFLLGDNVFSGTLPAELFRYLRQLTLFDAGSNILSGSLDDALAALLPLLTASIPNRSTTTSASVAVVDDDSIAGGSISTVTLLQQVNLGENRLTGAIPNSLFRMYSLELLILSDNELTGTLPTPSSTSAVTSCKSSRSRRSKRNMDDEETDDSEEDEEEEEEADEDSASCSQSENIDNDDSSSIASVPALIAPTLSYDNLSSLRVLWLARNQIGGALPSELFVGLGSSLETLDMSNNRLTGTIPTEIGLLYSLYNIEAMSNRLRGTLPTEMLHMNRNLRLNFTDNLITGSIPAMFCGEGKASTSMLYQEFGCDAVLCRPGTFSIYGHATLHSACRPCPKAISSKKVKRKACSDPDLLDSEGCSSADDENDEQNEDSDSDDDPPQSKVLGRTSCPGVDFVHGDLDGDGVLSPREILRMMYIDALGRFWGLDFHKWADVKYGECELTGVTCVKGHIVKLDLGTANMCSDGDRKPAPLMFCKGIPTEIGLLTNLEILQLTRQKFLRGSLPTEIGQLSKLRFLDLTSCSSMVGTLPTELGLLTNLRALKIAHTQFHGSIPSEVFNLELLEVLHLTNNRFSGTLPPTNLFNIKELMFARNNIAGSLPSEIALLTKMENFEAYHNNLSGKLPKNFGDCTSLKRIDLFNNALTGPLPESIVDIEGLQILHLKLNRLSGTIPELGKIPLLSWVDLSDNLFHGTIPQSFGSSRGIEDLRLGGNMLYEPIPHGLCTNPKLNGGVTKSYGCDGVICPLGTYSDSGHATELNSCTKCPPGYSTYYLGSQKTGCQLVTRERVLSILYEVTNGEKWPGASKENWGSSEVSVCQWAGLSCNEQGELIGVSFPLRGLEQYY